MLEEYRFHPEPKSASTDGAQSNRLPVGLLARRPVYAIEVSCIGKEATDLEGVQTGLVHDAEDVFNVNTQTSPNA